VRQFARIPYQKEDFDRFARIIFYYTMDISDPCAYQGLNAYYGKFCPRGEHLFYYAVAPELFLPITNGLKASIAHPEHAKVIVEKPFGVTLTDATHLYGKLLKVFRTENIYHIDHYLGKQMVQNLIAVRFQNAIFQGIWNNRFIDNIQINAFEKGGVGTRGGYYDQSGALKDMVQNHLFQILSLVAMEEPASEEIASLHKAQLRVLQDLIPIDPKNVNDYMVLGQYEGYREEDKVDPDSTTDTYAAMKIMIDNERWKGVPFYIRTGKKLQRRGSEVIVEFKATGRNAPKNLLIVRIQPDEGVYLTFNIKHPGTDADIQRVSMDFFHDNIEENRINTPEAYERLLKACMEDDRSMFSQWGQIVVSWKYIDRMLSAYQTYSNTLHSYAPGTHGPSAADHLPARTGRHWIDITETK
jgi:glucose-6-phosphate 1-dehydrogenase